MMNLYNTIFIRRSCRVYSDKLNDDNRKKLDSFILNSIKPLDETINYKIEIVNPDKIKSSRLTAQQYLLFYSEESPNAKLNAGFILQQIDLYIQSLGAGSCWLGLASPMVTKIGDMKYIIMLAIGETDKPLRRSLEEFKRKPIEEVGNALGNDLLQAIRLAPSAVNGQPWFYSQIDDNTIRVDLRRKALMKPILYKYDHIDLGISLFHLSIALDVKEIKNKIYIKDNKKNGIVYVKLLSE